MEHLDPRRLEGNEDWILTPVSGRDSSFGIASWSTFRGSGWLLSRSAKQLGLPVNNSKGILENRMRIEWPTNSNTMLSYVLEQKSGFASNMKAKSHRMSYGNSADDPRPIISANIPIQCWKHTFSIGMWLRNKGKVVLMRFLYWLWLIMNL
jgi:hypothetical protein